MLGFTWVLLHEGQDIGSDGFGLYRAATRVEFCKHSNEMEMKIFFGSTRQIDNVLVSMEYARGIWAELVSQNWIRRN